LLWAFPMSRFVTVLSVVLCYSAWRCFRPKETGQDRRRPQGSLSTMAALLRYISW